MEAQYGEFTRYLAKDLTRRYYKEMYDGIKDAMAGAKMFGWRDYKKTRDIYLSDYAICTLKGKNDTGIALLVSSSEYIDMCKRLTGENSKKMVFYEVGVGYDESKGILDPWGRPYQVILDVDYDGKIKNTVEAVSAVNKVNGRTGQDLRTKVGVYSFGVVENDKIAKDINKLASKKKLVISW